MDAKDHIINISDWVLTYIFTYSLTQSNGKVEQINIWILGMFLGYEILQIEISFLIAEVG